MNQSITVYAATHRHGVSKKTEKEYSLFQALYESPIETVDTANYKLDGAGLELKELFIPEADYHNLVKNNNFPVKCDVSFDADLATGRLKVKSLAIAQ